MDEDGAAPESIATVTGGSKPVHRFLRGQPKSNGVVLLLMGLSLVLFGIITEVLSDMHTSMKIFIVGILFSICGLLYILSEQNPSKKIITASLAMSIISILGVLYGCLEFLILVPNAHYEYSFYMLDNLTGVDQVYARQYYNAVFCMACVFFCHTLIGGVLLVVMACFARAGLRSSNTQAIVVMRNLPSAE